MISNVILSDDEMILFKKVLTTIAVGLDMNYKAEEIISSDDYKIEILKISEEESIVIYKNGDSEVINDMNRTIYVLQNKIYLTGKGCHIKNRNIQKITHYSGIINHITMISIIKTIFPYSGDLEIMSHLFTVLLDYQSKY